MRLDAVGERDSGPLGVHANGLAAGDGNAAALIAVSMHAGSCLDKRIEHALHAVAPREELRMPLHPDHKALIAYLDSLHQAVGSIRHRVNAGGKVAYPPDDAWSSP